MNRAITAPDTAPPTTPGNFARSTGSATSIPTSWSASTDNVSQVYYTLFINGAPEFAGAIGPRSYVILDRTPATTYLVRVRAADASGNFVDSDTLAVTTPKRGIGHQTLASLGEFASKWKSSLYEALFAESLGTAVNARAVGSLHEFGRFVNEVGRYENRLEAFADEFSAFLSRQLDERSR